LLQYCKYYSKDAKLALTRHIKIMIYIFADEFLQIVCLDCLVWMMIVA